MLTVRTSENTVRARARIQQNNVPEPLDVTGELKTISTTFWMLTSIKIGHSAKTLTICKTESS